jgi:membrane-associated phospholipid phosphatase
MCISTVTTGWHYVIDVIGGLAVAIFAQAVAVWVFRQWVQTKLAVASEPS